MIPASKWIWRGIAGHFVAADRCCFKLHTQIGNYRVSTVGCYHPRDAVDKNTPEEIGCGRLYETMVFALDEGHIVSWSELDSDAYNDNDAAERGHMAMCRKVARGKVGWDA